MELPDRKDNSIDAQEHAKVQAAWKVAVKSGKLTELTKSITDSIFAYEQHLIDSAKQRQGDVIKEILEECSLGDPLTAGLFRVHLLKLFGDSQFGLSGLGARLQAMRHKMQQDIESQMQGDEVIAVMRGQAGDDPVISALRGVVNKYHLPDPTKFDKYLNEERKELKDFYTLDAFRFPDSYRDAAVPIHVMMEIKYPHAEGIKSIIAEEMERRKITGFVRMIAADKDTFTILLFLTAGGKELRKIEFDDLFGSFSEEQVSIRYRTIKNRTMPIFSKFLILQPPSKMVATLKMVHNLVNLSDADPDAEDGVDLSSSKITYTPGFDPDMSVSPQHTHSEHVSLAGSAHSSNAQVQQTQKLLIKCVDNIHKALFGVGIQQLMENVDATVKPTLNAGFDEVSRRQSDGGDNIAPGASGTGDVGSAAGGDNIDTQHKESDQMATAVYLQLHRSISELVTRIGALQQANDSEMERRKDQLRDSIKDVESKLADIANVDEKQFQEAKAGLAKHEHTCKQLLGTSFNGFQAQTQTLGS